MNEKANPQEGPELPPPDIEELPDEPYATFERERERIISELPQTTPFNMADIIERPFVSSARVTNLFGALAKAQGQFKPVEADKVNQYNKSKYASIGSYLEAVREPMSANGLGIIQIPDTSSVGKVVVETMIFHESGEWISCVIEAPVITGKQMNPLQEVGNALTYVRRYGITSILCLAVFDTDGVPPGEGTTADAALTEEQSTELYNLAVELFGDDADDALAKMAKLIFKADSWANIPSNMFDTAVDQLKNRAKGKSK